MRARITGMVAIASAALMVLPQAAQADPKKGTPIQLACSDGNTYQTVGEGQGEFDPVHGLDSTAMFVPTWLGDQVVTGYAQDGSIAFQELPPDQYKGNSSGRQPNELSCSFSFSVYVIDQQAGPLHIVGSGEVRGFTTG